MEPLFFKAENSGEGSIVRASFRRLQWSRFFSKRKMADRRQLETETPCFNGAAFFQSGKSTCTVPRYASRRNGASMEPLFFKAENQPDAVIRPRVVQALQWSRFFSKRKMRLTVALPASPL